MEENGQRNAGTERWEVNDAFRYHEVKHTKDWKLELKVRRGDGKVESCGEWRCEDRPIIPRHLQSSLWLSVGICRDHGFPSKPVQPQRAGIATVAVITGNKCIHYAQKYRDKHDMTVTFEGANG